jgi:hypothetical protein
VSKPSLRNLPVGSVVSTYRASAPAERVLAVKIMSFGDGVWKSLTYEAPQYVGEKNRELMESLRRGNWILWNVHEAREWTRQEYEALEANKALAGRQEAARKAHEVYLEHVEKARALNHAVQEVARARDAAWVAFTQTVPCSMCEALTGQACVGVARGGNHLARGAIAQRAL